jgi:FO synthase
VLQGAKTLGVSRREFLLELKANGLGSMPGTAAEILHDDVRKLICADKLSAREWVETVGEAHEVGIPTTSTIMFGHIDSYAQWAVHLIEIRELQRRTGGITEFVPLPFVATEAPIYRRGNSRHGPTARESILMHSVARLVFSGLIDNIQASWVKLGLDGVAACLEAGANDLGGTLMNESITRAAGASHGEEVTPAEMRRLISRCGRQAEQRTTLYAAVELPSGIAVEDTIPLNPVENTAAGRLHRSKAML